MIERINLLYIDYSGKFQKTRSNSFCLVHEPNMQFPVIFFLVYTLRLKIKFVLCLLFYGELQIEP